MAKQLTVNGLYDKIRPWFTTTTAVATVVLSISTAIAAVGFARGSSAWRAEMEDVKASHAKIEEHNAAQDQRIERMERMFEQTLKSQADLNGQVRELVGELRGMKS